MELSRSVVGTDLCLLRKRGRVPARAFRVRAGIRRSQVARSAVTGLAAGALLRARTTAGI
jgi:hypothetical protein